MAVPKRKTTPSKRGVRCTLSQICYVACASRMHRDGFGYVRAMNITLFCGVKSTNREGLKKTPFSFSVYTYLLYARHIILIHLQSGQII